MYGWGLYRSRWPPDKARSLKTSTHNLIVKGCAIDRDSVSVSKESRAL